MLPRRDDSTIGTVIGVIVVAIAIVGSTFYGWTWENPEGKLLPLVIGGVAAAAAVIVVVRKIRG